MMRTKKGPSLDERRNARKFTMEEIERHHKVCDGWIVVNERVYDITAFVKTHPGFNNAGQVSTALAIARGLGKDVTEEFVEIHSNTAWMQLRDFQIGVVWRDDDDDDDDDEQRLSNDNENNEYVGNVIPEWLKKDRDFWVRYSGGVDENVLRYLTKNGYPQYDDDDEKDSVDNEKEKYYYTKAVFFERGSSLDINKTTNYDDDDDEKKTSKTSKKRTRRKQQQLLFKLIATTTIAIAASTTFIANAKKRGG